MNNLLVFPSLHRLTPTGEHVGFITELDYFNKHKVKTPKAQSIAIQAYLSKVGRYSDKKDDDGNYINQVHAVDWSGMFFLDYDMQKEYKGTKEGEKAVEKVIMEMSMGEGMDLDSLEDMFGDDVFDLTRFVHQQQLDGGCAKINTDIQFQTQHSHTLFFAG